MPGVRDIATVQWLKDTFLLGVDLTLDDGSDYPDIAFTQALDYAVRAIEDLLDIHIDPVTIEKERHDLYRPEALGWWPYVLKRGPLLKLEGWALRYGNSVENVMPPSWLLIDEPLQSALNIVPSTEGVDSVVIQSVYPLFFGFSNAGRNYLPGYFTFDYQVGFPVFDGQVSDLANGDVTLTFDTPSPHYRYEVTLSVIDVATGQAAAGASASVKTRAKGQTVVTVAGLGAGTFRLDWQVSTVPADILQAIGLTAALLPLDVAGDLIAGAGIASTSVSVDGLSQSINTTSSATNSGYGARVLQFTKELKELVPRLKAQYQRLNMGVV